MNAMNSDLKKVDIRNPNEDAILKTIKEHAVQSLGVDASESRTEYALAQAAYVATRIRLLKLTHVGGCPRDMSATCPVGWESSGAACVAHSDYEGRCGEIAHSKLQSPQAKENISWRCGVSWPCLAACTKSFANCPQGWTSAGTLCKAPAKYDGICSPSMDFATYSVDDKIEWGVMCGAEWLTPL